MNKHSNTSKLSNPWVYFAVTFVWTWSFWGLAIVLGLSSETASGIILQLLGVIGPMVTGIVFTYLTRDKEGRRDYWSRIIDPRRIGIRWFLVTILIAPVLSILGALIDILLGGTGATWGEAALHFTSDPLAIIPSILFASLIPFIEELGWRGYVLDRMQSKWNALVSSLILGVVWSLWHLPLFFIEGSYQQGLGIGTLAFWMFFLGIVPLTAVFTWIYNNTRRSTLAVILLHSMVNFSGELIALTERADAFWMGWFLIAAVVITAVWGPKTFTRNKGAQ